MIKRNQNFSIDVKRSEPIKLSKQTSLESSQYDPYSKQNTMSPLKISKYAPIALPVESVKLDTMLEN